MEERYVMVCWPEVQDFMQHPRWDECYNCNNVIKETGTVLYAIPESLYNEVICKKIHNY